MASESGQERCETLADLVSDLRAKARKFIGYHGVGWSEGGRLMSLADRIEAAWRREKAEWEAAACACVSDAVMSGRVAVEHEPVGNAAAMREALKTTLNALKTLSKNHSVDLPEDVRALLGEVAFNVNDALSAPARNCDLPLAVDGPATNNADKAWLVFKRHNPDAYFDVYGLLRCIDWLLAPAAQEGAGE